MACAGLKCTLDISYIGWSCGKRIAVFRSEQKKKLTYLTQSLVLLDWKKCRVAKSLYPDWSKTIELLMKPSYSYRTFYAENDGEISFYPEG